MNQQNLGNRRNPFILGVCVGLLGAIGIWGLTHKTTSPTSGDVPDPAAVAEPAPAGANVPSALPAAPPPAVAQAAPITYSPTVMEEQWGIRILGLSLMNDDTAVQLRYTVLAPEKTRRLRGRNTVVYLVNQATGARLPVLALPAEGTAPQGASLRTTSRMLQWAGQFPPQESKLMAGGDYSLAIPNWGLALQSGSKVSLLINESGQKDLTVD